MRTYVLFSTLLVAGWAAGCGSSSTDDAAKFAGNWTFSPGVAMCAASTISFSLTGVPVIITRVDASDVTLTAGSDCSIAFTVAGTTATAGANQTCTLDTQAGPQTITVASWMLTIGGDQITNAASGTASVCAVTVTGTLVRDTADAGPPTDTGAG